MINIRPHHLLCMHAFAGRGYDSDFISHMREIVETIINHPDMELNIVFNTDDVCSTCPHKTEMVSRLDHDVADILNLEEKVYSYKEILDRMKNHLNEANIERVCSGCEWYLPCRCKERLLHVSAR